MLKGENMGFEHVRSLEELKNCKELKNCNVNFSYVGFDSDVTLVYRRRDGSSIMLNHIIDCIRNIDSFYMTYAAYPSSSIGDVRPAYNIGKLNRVTIMILRRLHNQLNIVFGYSIRSKSDAYNKTFGQRVALERLVLSILKESEKMQKHDSLEELIT